MGQKTHPKGFRLRERKNWMGKWFAENKDFASKLIEDERIRAFLIKKPSCQGISSIHIKRMGEKVEVTIVTPRPGHVIGKKGAEIDVLKADLAKFIGKEVWIEVEEVKRPDLDPQIVADGIAKQLERRIPFRRAVKKAIQSTMDAGALGVKIQVSGCLGGAEIARTEWSKQGSIPSQTIKADVRYSTATAQTTHGSIGIKVWIYCGEINLQKKERAHAVNA